jgi:SAM-dependent methyltransferase
MLDAEQSVADIGARLGEEKINIIISPFEKFNFKEKSYDLVHARVSLPFIAPENFDETFEKIKTSLKPEGVLVVDFFGNNDGWAGRDNMTFKTKDELEDLLQDFNIISLEEEDQDGKTASGKEKHWHIFHVIAQKPLADDK